MLTWLASIAPALQVAGLVITTAAAALMGVYPPRVRQYSPDGQAHVTWVTPVATDMARTGRRQVLLSKVGPWLLAVGFVLQLPSAVLALA